MLWVFEEFGWNYEKKEGEAKFYGPSLDLHIQDRNGKYWQCSTLQFDFNLPGRFNVHYYDAEGIKRIPFMLHRAVFGSLERFMGILLEYYQGALPLWMAPIQVRVLALEKAAHEKAKEILSHFWDEQIRVDLDLREDHINEKILRAQNAKIPLMIILGKKELNQGILSIRSREGERFNLSPSELVEKIKAKGAGL